MKLIDEMDKEKKRYARFELYSYASNMPELIHIYFTHNKYRLHMFFKNTWNIHKSQH